MKAKFVYRKSDNRFFGGGFYDVQLPRTPEGDPDEVNYGIAEFGDADQPDIEADVFDSVRGKRRMTAQERTTRDDEKLTEQAELTSRQKDMLATIAWTVRFRDPSTWNAMTTTQKRNAVFTQADIWRDIRVLVDKL